MEPGGLDEFDHALKHLRVLLPEHTSRLVLRTGPALRARSSLL
jgi:hypothetical protein